MQVWSLKKFKPQRKLILITAALLLFILIIFAAKLLWFANHTIQTTDERILVDITPGSSFVQFSNQLVSANLFSPSDKRQFILLAILTGNLHQLRMGEYAITATTTPWQLLSKVTKGLVVQHKVTFPEGITFQEVLSILQKNSNVKLEIATLPLDQIREQLSITANSVEGVFYPDTYVYPKGTSDRKILTQALNQMRTIVAEEWLRRAKDQPYKSAYQALIAASLVEKETANDDERYLIATVIANRLRINMLLQIDPTVIYGMGDDYNGKLLRSHLKYNSPYNTYLNLGLPPSPIALSSRKSINAALHPLKTENLYYVSRGDGTGTHIFANTLTDHVKNIKFVKRQKTVETSHEQTQ